MTPRYVDRDRERVVSLLHLNSDDVPRALRLLLLMNESYNTVAC